MSFYVVKYEYVGPNQDEWLNLDHIVIQTEPATKYGSNEEVISGHVYTYNDVAHYAHGEYETLEEARAYIDSTWHARPNDDDLIGRGYHAGEIECFLIGERESMTAEWSREWCQDAGSEITKDTSDEDIEKLVKWLKTVALDEINQNLDTRAVTKMLIEERDQRQEEAAEEAEEEGE